MTSLPPQTKKHLFNSLKADKSAYRIKTFCTPETLLSYRHILGIVLLDPEKMAVHAQSGRAMEALHKPIVEKINKIRPYLEPKIKELAKIIETIATEYNTKNVKAKKELVEESKTKWGDLFPDTPADLSLKIGATAQATTGKFLSRKSATHYAGRNFEVENP